MKSLRDANRRPTHPGAVLREDVLPDMAVRIATLLQTSPESWLRMQ